MENIFETKRLPTISDRLRAVADAAGHCNILFDIGTDHSYVPIYCLINKMCNSAVASDIRQGPLKAAAANVSRFKLSDKVMFAQTDGLTGLVPSARDCVVIAGMGGCEIISILSKVEKCEARFILQPQSSIPELREYLTGNGYRINNEYHVSERKKYYLILDVSYVGVNDFYKFEELYLGKQLYRFLTDDANFIEKDLIDIGYLNYLRNKLSKEMLGKNTLAPIYNLVESVMSNISGGD